MAYRLEGLEMEEFRPFLVDEYVQGAVLYKDDGRSVTLPHLAGEWKGPDRSMAEATLQSTRLRKKPSPRLPGKI